MTTRGRRSGISVSELSGLSRDALCEFKDAKAFLVPEQNLGQIAREIERHTPVPVIRLPRFGGSLHTPEELTSALETFK